MASASACGKVTPALITARPGRKDQAGRQKRKATQMRKLNLLAGMTLAGLVLVGLTATADQTSAT
jgi:hypothetical protein